MNEAGARAFLDRVDAELRTAMLLTRSRDVRALRDSPRVIVGELATWLKALSR
jgi:isopentenyl diphosphate isomerase/L-lactate dehydrogenase-like FMN-dependent dehydrogenase